MAFGRIEKRLAAAIVLTALIPLLGAIFLAQSAVKTSSSRFFKPEIGIRLDEALGLYQELARADKAALGHQATALAEGEVLRVAVRSGDAGKIEGVLRGAIERHPDLVSLTVVDGDRRVVSVDRGRPVDEARELTLELRRPLGGAAGQPEGASPSPGASPAQDEWEEGEIEGLGQALVVVFAAEKARYEGLDGMSAFVDQYRSVEGRRQADERAYLLAFAVLLGITIVAAIAVGILMARGVSRRIVRLAEATRRVGAGDLTIRVDESNGDEVGDLTRAFNRMVGEVESSRSRIEYLQRIGAWQEMARRLAHEIKNPLTPIQLAVEEIHQRYAGGEPRYQKLLDATLEVVQAEVGTLRRLVTEFSDFARLPQAHLEPGDLVAFLREQEELGLLAEDASQGAGSAEVAVSFELPGEPAPVHIDVQMLRRVLANLVRNSAQAIRDDGRGAGVVRLSLHREGERDAWTLDIDDDGPGIPEALRDRAFDPYVTTKGDGTGLGLAIVKKIVVEHGGLISALSSPLGGARVRITLPASGSAQASAVLEGQSRSEAGPPGLEHGPTP